MTSVEVGLEHEFTVDRDGTRVDFRSLIHDLDLPGRAIDPGDEHAYRLDTGVIITCDDTEAEIATVPVPIEPGWPDELTLWATAGASSLIEALPNADLEGWSTHLSVTADIEHVARAAGLFSRTFAPALMMLMEQRDSAGLLIRPRYQRLEFGGDYVSGASMQAAAAMAVGGALTCLDVAAKRRSKRDLPPAVKVKVVAAVDRHGWYVDRAAFGFDLPRAGRNATFRREYYGSIGGQQLLENAWHVARSALAARSSEVDLAAADVVVAGDLPIPAERAPDRTPVLETTAIVGEHPMGLAMQTHTAGETELEAVVATWDYVVFRLTGAHEGFWSVTRRDLTDALAMIRNGSLARLLGELDWHETLSSYDEAAAGGCFLHLTKGRKLAPPEPGRDGVFRLAT